MSDRNEVKYGSRQGGEVILRVIGLLCCINAADRGLEKGICTDHRVSV